jgi:hypothetical protein
MSSHDNGDKGHAHQMALDNAINPVDQSSTAQCRHAWLSAQVKPLRQYLKCSRHDFLRFFAELRVEVRMIESVDPALESRCVLRSIKELSRDAQRTDAITSGPGGTNLVGLANACH